MTSNRVKDTSECDSIKVCNVSSSWTRHLDWLLDEAFTRRVYSGLASRKINDKKKCTSIYRSSRKNCGGSFWYTYIHELKSVAFLHFVRFTRKQLQGTRVLFKRKQLFVSFVFFKLRVVLCVCVCPPNSTSCVLVFFLALFFCDQIHMRVDRVSQRSAAKGIVSYFCFDINTFAVLCVVFHFLYSDTLLTLLYCLCVALWCSLSFRCSTKERTEQHTWDVKR